MKSPQSTHSATRSLKLVTQCVTSDSMGTGVSTQGNLPASVSRLCLYISVGVCGCAHSLQPSQVQLTSRRSPFSSNGGQAQEGGEAEQ